MYVPTRMVSDNEGCDAKGGGDEGMASTEYHDNKWAFCRWKVDNIIRSVL